MSSLAETHDETSLMEATVSFLQKREERSKNPTHSRKFQSMEKERPEQPTDRVRWATSTQSTMMATALPPHVPPIVIPPPDDSQNPPSKPTTNIRKAKPRSLSLPFLSARSQQSESSPRADKNAASPVGLPSIAPLHQTHGPIRTADSNPHAASDSFPTSQRKRSPKRQQGAPSLSARTSQSPQLTNYSTLFHMNFRENIGSTGPAGLVHSAPSSSGTVGLLRNQLPYPLSPHAPPTYQKTVAELELSWRIQANDTQRHMSPPEPRIRRNFDGSFVVRQHGTKQFFQGSDFKVDLVLDSHKNDKERTPFLCSKHSPSVENFD